MRILAALEKQTFANWYNEGGKFDDYITGGWQRKVPTKEEILEQIEKMFNL